MRLTSLSAFVVIIPVAGAIIVALWLAGAAAFENVRFERAKLQLLPLIAMAQDDAKDPDFGKRADEDLVDSLARRGQLPGLGDDPAGRLMNIWHGAIRMTAVSPAVMRLETDIPSHECRRLALFFGRDARDMKLQAMEARTETSHWRAFFDSASGQIPDNVTVTAACGAGEHDTTLALMIRLR